MKRLFALALALCLVFSLTGCGSKADRTDRKEALSAMKGNYTTDYAMDDVTEITPTELYNDSDIIIKLVGISGTTDAPSLAFAVRNGTKSTLHFSVNYLQINGCVMNCYFDKSQLSARTVTMNTLEAYNDFSPLNPYGDYVWSISLSFDLYDDDYNTIGTVTYDDTTSSYTGDEEPVTLEGYNLLDQDGFTANILQVDIGETASTVTMYFQNDTDQHIYFSTNHVTLNGEEASLWFWDELQANARTLEYSYIYDEDTYDNIVLSDEDELSFSLEVTNYDTGEVLISKDYTMNVGELRAALGS